MKRDGSGTMRSGFAFGWMMVSGLALIAGTPAFAQAVAEKSPADEQGGQATGDIVVTAEKRQSTVQKTPISMSALTGPALQSQGITDLQRMVRQIPGVSFRTTGPGQTEYQMRGMASSGGALATVGFYIDEVSLLAPANSQTGKTLFDPNLFDLGRVEVLRGPQGTLYGAGSMGGTIKLVTNAPDPGKLTASGQAVGSYTDGGKGNYAVNAALNVPLVEEIAALRMVFSYKHDGGWIDRIVASPFPAQTDPCTGFVGCTRGDVATAPVAKRYRNVNDTDLIGGRAALLVKPTDRLDVTVSGMIQKITADGYNQYDSPPGRNAHYQPLDVPESFYDRFYVGSLVANYDADVVGLTSVTAYWKRDQSQIQDTVEIVSDVLGLPVYAVADGGLGATPFTEATSSKQFSQEVRAASQWDGPFQAIVGGLYSDFKSFLSQDFHAPGGPPIFGTTNIFTKRNPSKLVQKALFGELSYALTDKLKATAGARYYDYKATFTSTVSGIASVSGNDTPTTTVYRRKDRGINPKFNLSYTFDPDLMVYATAARGFRPGSGNELVPVGGTVDCSSSLAAVGQAGSPATYGPDSVWSYEVGQKARFMDRRVTLNASAFFQKWKDIQQFVALQCGFGYTGNTGTADIYGGEIEFSAQISDELFFSASGGYTHAALTADGVGSKLKKGAQLFYVPKLSLSQSIAYERPIDDRHSLLVRVDNQFVGARRDPYQQRPLPSYDITAVRLGVRTDQWTAQLFVDNLFDTRAALSNAQSLVANTPSLNRVVANQPRTVGLDLSYRY